MGFPDVSLPKVIHEALSDYNGKIQVIDHGRTRRLSVDGVIQSINWDSPSVGGRVWGKLADLLKEKLPDMRSVIILGLGGGTMAHLISREFPDAHITSVEIDPAIVEVAKKHFDLDSIKNHKVIVDDALKVVAEPDKFGILPNSFDALVVDIYCGEKYPDLGRSGTFFAGIKKIVASGGLVVFNRIYLKSHQESVDIFIDHIGETFSDVSTRMVAGRSNSDNMLIFGRV